MGNSAGLTESQGNAELKFALQFQTLTGHEPFPWQADLYWRFTRGDVPEVCNIPTGLGKASVIPIWAIALANSLAVPQRLVYVINRRTVVDQASEEAIRLRERVPFPLAISTLRGEMADNEEWSTDPARAAVIVGTIDMIGSRLLFSGYGDGYKRRPHHAGLLGQDSLIVHDEAHLTPAFSVLLRDLAAEQRKSNEPRPIRVMELSATSRQASGTVLSLSAADEQHEIVAQRLKASKRLVIHSADRSSLPQKLVELAAKFEDQKVKVLIYTRQPEVASKIKQALSKLVGDDCVALLTGTIRGYERDLLAKDNPTLRALRDSVRVDRSVYLVSTSAGEVGVDWDADHLVSDLDTLDSMVQRLGRTNRRGSYDSQVHVVATQTDNEERQARCEATEAALRRLPRREAGYDASPSALRSLLAGLTDAEREAAFSSQPRMVALTDILLDLWSLTSIRDRLPGRPEVARFLHGITVDPPETYMAWRQEVGLFGKAKIDSETLSEWFDSCRIEPRERLHDVTVRIAAKLQQIAKTRRHLPVVVLNSWGRARLVVLADLCRGRPQDVFERLAYQTIVLPVEAGGLSLDGFFDPAVMDPAKDVAEYGGHRLRQVLSSEDHATEVANDHAMVISLMVPLGETDEEEAESYLGLFVKRTADDSVASLEPVSLADHTAHVEAAARSIGERLSLDAPLREALALAAKWHDRGKDRQVWQEAIHHDGAPPMAKAGLRGMNPRILAGYRHEFGSLLEAAADRQIATHAEQDLILHLIAAHHGRARPHFEPDAHDRERPTNENSEAALEAMRRFSRLQKRLGRWGLAWLEALLRCADARASEQAREVRPKQTVAVQT